MDETSKIEMSYWERMARQIRIFGTEGQKKIASTKLAIAGCGGNGSAVAQLCSLAGFRYMHLIDPDRLEPHNLNRFVLGGVRDVGKYKVLVAKRTLHRLFRGMRIKALPQDIRSPGIWEQVKDCDWLLEATDSDPTRLWLNQQCSQDGIPVVSVASGFRTRDGKLVGAGCRANRVRVGDACLKCQALSDESAEHPRISLVIPNMIASSMCLDFLLREITGYAGLTCSQGQMDVHPADQSKAPVQDSKNFVVFDLVDRTLAAEKVIPSPGCPFCDRLASGAEQV